MLTIKLHFIRLSDVSLAAIYDQTGVYVWSGKAKAVPSYIGEGDVLERFKSHTRKQWAARPIDDVIALIEAPTSGKQKAYAELAEAALLHVEKSSTGLPRTTAIGASQPLPWKRA